MAAVVQPSCGDFHFRWPEESGRSMPMVTFTCNFEIAIEKLMAAYEATRVDSTGGHAIAPPCASEWLNFGVEQKLMARDETYIDPVLDRQQVSTPDSRDHASDVKSYSVTDLEDHTNDVKKLVGPMTRRDFANGSIGACVKERVHEQAKPPPPPPPSLPPLMKPPISPDKPKQPAKEMGANPPAKSPPAFPPPAAEVAESAALQGVSWLDRVRLATTSSSMFSSEPVPTAELETSQEDVVSTQLLDLSERVLHHTDRRRLLTSQVSCTEEDNVISIVLREMATLANALKEDAFEILSDGKPRKIKDVLSFKNISTRFNLIFGDQLENDGMCMTWLTSFDGIEYADSACESDSGDCFIYLKCGENLSQSDPHDIWLQKLWEKARDVHLLEADVFEVLTGTQPKNTCDILLKRDIGSRFKQIIGLQQDGHVHGLWKDWLESIPNVVFAQGNEDYACVVGSNQMSDVLEPEEKEKRNNALSTENLWDDNALETWLNNGNKTWKQALLQSGHESRDADSPTVATPNSDLETCFESTSNDIHNSDQNASFSSDAKTDSPSTRSDKPSIIEWVAAPNSAPFEPTHGKNTKEAKQLEKDVLDLLADGTPRGIGKLYATANMQPRFITIFFRGQAVRKAFWKKWLASLPGVELIHDASISVKDITDDDIYARRQYIESNGMVAVFDVGEALNLLKGTWKSHDGSTYEVTVCVMGKSLSVRMTRPTGQIEFRKGVIEGRLDEVIWGIKFKLSQVSSKRASWQGRNKAYEWTKIKESASP